MTSQSVTSLQLRHLRIRNVPINGDAATANIACIEFARPDVANALNYEHLHDIETAAQALRDDERTRAVIFTGQGKHFSSGADLSDPGDAYRGSLALRRRKSRIGERAIQAVLGIDQITIAAWN